MLLLKHFLKQQHLLYSVLPPHMADGAVDDYLFNRNEAKKHDFHQFHVNNHSNVRYL